nr:immunoglobulin light chain junction region [Macaca mulatta]
EYYCWLYYSGVQCLF